MADCSYSRPLQSTDNIRTRSYTTLSLRPVSLLYQILRNCPNPYMQDSTRHTYESFSAYPYPRLLRDDRAYRSFCILLQKISKLYDIGKR